MLRTRNKVEIADIFRQYFDEFKQKYRTPKYIKKVVSDIIFCRTAKLGGHIEVCEECGHTQISYNSCRNRHCPKCQFIKKEKWVLEKNKDVLPIEYFHIVFTIPAKLNLLMYQNSRGLYDLLMKCAGKTITELGKESKYINCKTGAICVLHTWGQKLELHPHVHCIVPGGGLSVDNKSWISCKKGYFLPVKVLSKRFRRLFLDELKRKYKNDALFLGGSLEYLKNAKLFQEFIDELYKTDWVVYSKRPFQSVNTVINYLSKYTHRIAISNYRIVKLENDNVYFTYRDYKENNQKKIMCLSAVEFIRRFLLHVLPFRFVKIRYVGILSNRTRENNIKLCREILGINLEDVPLHKVYIDFAQFLLDTFGFDVRKCPKCKGRLVVIDNLWVKHFARAP